MVLILMSIFFSLDTDGFVIPSLGIEEPDKNAPEVETSEPPPQVNCNLLSVDVESHLF